MGILDALRDPQFRQDVKTNARNFGQSASNTLAGNVAAPLDLIAFALRKAGIPMPEPVGGSQWMENQGLTREVPPGAPKVAGEAFGLIAPLAGTPQNASAIAQMIRQMQENGAAPAMMNKQNGAINAGAFEQLRKQFPELDYFLSQKEMTYDSNPIIPR